jgi:ADP-ribose pyrophosphatase YjhB (NUDIX family)
LEHGDVVKLLAETGNEPINGINNIMGILAAREAREECGLKVDSKESAIINNKVFVRPDGIPVFLAFVTAKFDGGEVKIEEEAFTESAWVSLEDLHNYDCIEDIPEIAKTAMVLYTSA